MQRIKRSWPLLGALAFMCLMAYLAQGCAGLQPRPSICDTLTEPSLLCDISKKYGVRLEDIGSGLIIVNAVAIGQGIYTREQAVRVMQDFRDVLDNPISYVYFKDEVYAAMFIYPGLLEVADIYFTELGANTKMMYRADRDLLIGFLDKQIKTLGG